MSYKPVRKSYTLTFEEHPGLEIVMRSTSLGKLQSIMETNLADVQRNPQVQTEFFEAIAGLIISWNFVHPEVETIESADDYHPSGPRCAICGLREDSEMPVSATMMKCLDIEMIMQIVQAWGLAIMRVSMGKGVNSSNGGMTIPEDMMRMLAEQQNPTKLPTPNFS